MWPPLTQWVDWLSLKPTRHMMIQFTQLSRSNLDDQLSLRQQMLGTLLPTSLWLEKSVQSYPFIKVFIPHVIDRATGSSHKQSSNAKQRQHAKVREASGVCGQPNTPWTRKIQQPRSYNNTMWIFYWLVKFNQSINIISPIGLSSLINLR